MNYSERYWRALQPQRASESQCFTVLLQNSPSARYYKVTVMPLWGNLPNTYWAPIQVLQEGHRPRIIYMETLRMDLSAWRSITCMFSSHISSCPDFALAWSFFALGALCPLSFFSDLNIFSKGKGEDRCPTAMLLISGFVHLLTLPI